MRNSASLIRKVNVGVQKLVYKKIINGRSGLIGFVLMLLSFAGTAQTVSPVTVTGFTADVIANGPTFAGSVTADVDGVGYYFLNQSFTAFGTPTYYLPTSGLIASTASTVTFQLADASANNSLRLAATNASGTLTLATPQTAGVVYFLATSGSGDGTISVTLNFSDGTTQTNTGINVPDWYGGNNFAKQGIGRVNGGATPPALDNAGGASNPRLYQLSLPVNGPNYSKTISSITVTRTSTAGYVQVMAVSMMNVCVAPVPQPTALVLNATSTSQINGSFTAASPAADAYIVVRYPAGATPVAPVNGTTYSAGLSMGTGIVVRTGAATSFSATNLIGGTAYDFYVYGYNNTNCIGPVYNTATPLTGTQSTNTCSGPSGIIPVGPTGTYPTLKAALTALANGVGGSVILELQSAYTAGGETFPITIPSNACLNATRTLTIRPETGANGLVITSANAGPTIDFNGAKYVTIDGRPGGIGTSIPVTAAGSRNTINLNIINTNNSGATIKLDTGASYNTIKYCDLQGQSTKDANVPTTLAGVVYFGNNGANGNDNNTIDHCNIHSTGTGVTKPSIGIYSNGFDNATTTAAYVPQFNDNNAVTGCNIYDYYAAGNSVGLEVNYGNTGWTIAANSFFQTEAITVSTANTSYNRAIWLIPYRGTAGEVGNGFVIVSNNIGGSAPNCAGTPYTLASGSQGYFEGIRVEVADAATPQAATSIQGNTIRNIFITTSSTSDAFHAMNITSGRGNVDIGSFTGNTIGSATGVNGYTDGGITITATGSVPSHMILIDGTYTIPVKNNIIGNVLLTAAGNSFSGIFTNNSITGNFSNNTITNITASNTGAGTATYINGIHVPSGSPVLTISNNIIQHLTSNYATTGTAASQVIGINIAATTAVVSGGITNNIIRNLANATQSTGTTTSSAIIGVNTNSTNAAGCNVTGNTIDSLVLTGTATAAAVNVIGIYYNATATVTNTLAKNFIHSFDATAANTSAIFTGIHINGGSSVYSNNMIRLGIKPDGTSLTTAQNINGIVANTTATNSFYHNSIYIGGSGVGTNAANTYSFIRSATSGTYDIRDNIFANTRSNATGGGKHFSIYFTTANTGANVNYNVYQYSGNGGRFAFSGTAEIANYTNGGTPTGGWISGDVNSVAGDPNFINPTGSASTVNLHINSTGTSVAEGTGTAIATITDDYDSETRSGLTPVDIGADAGNFVAAAATCTTPAAPTALVLTTISSTQIDGAFTASASGANGYLIVRYIAGATPVAPVDGINYSVGSSLGAGTVIATGASLSFANTGLMANTTYDYYVYAYNNACVSAIKYSTGLTGSKTTSACSGPSGLITVGPTGTYPTLTAALSALSGGISGPVIVELESTYTSTAETFPITIGASSCFTPSNTVLIRPAANANGLVITSAVPGPTIDFSGGTYVTIDGRPGGVGSAIGVTAAGSLNTTNLNIINTSAIGAAIRFDNNASFNNVKYCDLQGINAVGANVPATLAGVVYFGNNGVNGNDNNTIDHCNIHSAGTGTSIPSIGVYSLGANNTGVNTNFNDNDTISNCNIYDYFLTNGNSVGVELTQGVSGWVISGNSFFQTSTRTYTGAGYNRGIWAISNRNPGSVGNGFIITDNYIGGTAPAAAGTSYTLTALANYFEGIRLEVADGFPVIPSSVQGNTITNIAITSTIANDVFRGIAVTSSNGNVNIGTVTGNIVGSATGNNAITIAAGNGSHTIPYFISNSAGGTSLINLKQNIAGGITLSNAGNHFSGIFDNEVGTVNIDGNQIGSLITANSINSTNTGTTSRFMRGINIPSGAGTFTITNNTIANLSNNTTTTSTTGGAQTAGITIGSATSTVTAVSGNTIRNLYCATQSTAGSGNAALLGIYMGATTANAVTVSNNTIHSLTTGATTAGVYMEGIFFVGNNSSTVTNIISKNKVHSFDITTTNTNVNFRGIEVPSQGKADIYNNMVRLGIRPDGTSLTNAIRIDGIMKGSEYNSSIFFNSVYIGGTGVGTAARPTSAIRKETTLGTDNIRNNIFINNRSNATTGGLHNTIWVNGLTLLTFEHNMYGYGGTGGNFVSTNMTSTSFAATYTRGWLITINGDTTSQAADPLFVDATGSAATVDLHLTTSVPSPANAAGEPLAVVPDDIEGEARDPLTPDVGADEFTQSNGIDMQAVSLESPVTGKGCYGKEVVTIKVRNNSSVAIDFAMNPVTVTVNMTGAATATIDTTLSTGTLAGGATLDVKLESPTDTVVMSAAGTYVFAAKTTVAGDVKVSNDAMSIVTRTRVALITGTISASLTSYCFTGAPVLTMTGANGYSGIQWQQSPDSASYSNITNATTTPYATMAATQTLYYRLAAACISDTLFTPAVKVVINSPQVTSTTPGTRCNAGLVNLQATGSTGTTLYWYADATSTTQVGMGSTYTTPSIADTTTYYVMASAAGCNSPRTPVVATVNDRIAVTTQPVSQGVCMGSAVTFSIKATGSALAYQWRKDGVNIPGATSNAYTIANAVATDAGDYEVVITNPCGVIVSSVAMLSVQSSNNWVGNVSSDWNTAANWCGGVPVSTTNVTINAGTPFSPVVSGTANARTLTIGSGATVTVNASGTLNLYGNFVNSGTFNANAGTVAFRGTANQFIAAMSVGNVIMNGTGVTLNGNMTVTNSLTLTSGNITLGTYNIYLQNTATGSLASHIVTNGSGVVICTNVTGSVSVPVAPTATSYNPVIINNGQGMTYTVRVMEGLIASVIDNSKAINRTWTVTTTTTPASPVNITLQYGDADANANCIPTAAMDAGAYNGVTWALITPTGGAMPTGTSTARQVALSTTLLGSIVITNQGMLKAAVYEFNVQLLPTVVTGSSARLRISSTRAMNMNWAVLDVTGKMVKKFTTTLTAGMNDINVPMVNLASGVYTLRGVGDDGRTQVIRFVVQH